MRRSEREITDKSAMEDIINASIVCRLGLSDGDEPYIVPLCFGYQDGALYFHGAREGKKMDMIRKNPNVCFEFDTNTEMIEAEEACGWSLKYQSVVGFGKAQLVEDPDEKRKALDIIMNQYSDRAYQFPDKAVEKTGLIKVQIETMTGKQAGWPSEDG